MKPCRCHGIEITWACNISCKHCFYRRFEQLHTNEHYPVAGVLRKIDAAIERGCNRMTIYGAGEPMLHPKIEDIITGVIKKGMTTNIITNGTIALDKYKRLFDLGLNHMQISIHGLGSVADEIAETPGVGHKQARLLNWLQKNKLPFRTNTTMQKLNYRQLPEIMSYVVKKGAFHVVMLGFLPHYQWGQFPHLKEVAVHPATLRLYIEQAADVLIEHDKYFTIRYHPFCHLASKYWKYVVNARFVLFDPWEWDYEHYNPDSDKVWPHAIALGESVAIKGEPCNYCLMREHCGGWNKTYAAAFGGADLNPVIGIPDEYINVACIRGGLHDLNPANALEGMAP